MGDGEARRDPHWQGMLAGCRKVTPEPQVIVRKFLFPNLAGSAKAAASTAAPSSASSTAAVATVPPLISSAIRVLPRQTAAATATATTAATTVTATTTAPTTTAGSAFPPIAPKDEFGCRYFILNADGSTVGLVPYRSVIKRGGGAEAAPADKEARLLLRPGPAASAPPPAARPPPPVAAAQRVSGGNIRLQLHPAPSPATVLVRPLNGAAKPPSAAPTAAAPPRPPAPEAGKTVIVQGSPDGKSIVLKNPVILQPNGAVPSAGGSKMVVVKGLPKTVSTVSGQVVVMQPRELTVTTTAGAASSAATATSTTTTTAAGRSESGTLHLEVVVPHRPAAAATPAPSVVVAAPLQLPPGVRVLRVPARDLLVADAACQTDPPAISVPDSMLRLTLHEVDGSEPQTLPPCDYSSLWDNDSVRIRPASSSPPASQPQRTPSPLTRMPAAGDLVEAPLAVSRLGKHALPAAASTGDAGPPAKRPRTATATAADVRDLALRLFAFRDWACCLEQDDHGNVPLHCAVLAGDINRIKRQCCVLRARNYSLDICNNEGETPLHLAVIHKMTEAVEILIKFGAKPQFRDRAANTSFHLAVQRDAHCPEILSRLLSAPGLRKSDLELFNDDGYAPLHLCAMYDKVEELKALISCGADVNLKDTKSGRTPLFHAVETNSATCCRVLLHSGANSAEQNYAGHTPVIAASEFANPNIEAVMVHQNLKELDEDIITRLERGRHIRL